jgi:CrcB protein
MPDLPDITLYIERLEHLFAQRLAQDTRGTRGIEGAAEADLVTPMHLLYVLLGGAAGALARYGVGAGLAHALGSEYPWGTTTVNLVGSFLFGLLFALFEQRGGMSTPLRLLLMSGFLGAFTTFSTLMFEVAALLSAGRSALAFAHVGLQNALGLLLVFLGIWLGKAL